MAKKAWKLISGSIYKTKTAAGDFARGYRGGRFGVPKVKPGTVKVAAVGPYFGVFDSSAHPRGTVITMAEGRKQGNLNYKKRRL